MERNRQKFWIDLILFLLIFALNISKLTGISAHEWIGLALTPLFLWHLTLNWDSVFGAIRHFGKISGKAKIRLFWNILLWWMMGAALLTGFVTSRAILPAFGHPIRPDAFFSFLHKKLPPILLVMIGIHLGTHLYWIKARFASKKNNAEQKEVQP